MCADIVTERLVLRRFRVDDLPAFVAYRRQPEVACYQGWDESYSLADAEQFLSGQEAVELGRPGAWVQLAAVDRVSGSLVGDCASCVTTQPPDAAEIGVTLAPAHQGKGLGGEAVGALVAELFETHGVHRVIARADDRNEPVHRLFERIGLRCEGRLVDADWFKGEWTTLRVYALMRREWLGGSGRPRS